MHIVSLFKTEVSNFFMFNDHDKCPENSIHELDIKRANMNRYFFIIANFLFIYLDFTLSYLWKN